MSGRPKVGEPVPKFELPDSKGERRTLDSLLSEGNLLLIFFRGMW